MGVLATSPVAEKIMTEEQKQEEAPVIEQEEVKEQPVAEEKPAVTPPPEDHNWKQAREALKAQKQEIEELRRFIAEKNIPPPQEEKDEFADLDPDDYLTAGKAKKMAEAYSEKKAKQAARQAIEEYDRQQRLINDESRVRAKHEDYDYVVDNYALPLIKNNPALALQIQNSRNPAETAYKLGKLSDGYEEQTTEKPVSQKAEKILKNSSRPVSATAVGSPLKNQADQFSSMNKQEIWEMSQKFASKAS